VKNERICRCGCGKIVPLTRGRSRYFCEYCRRRDYFRRNPEAHKKHLEEKRRYRTTEKAKLLAREAAKRYRSKPEIAENLREKKRLYKKTRRGKQAIKRYKKRKWNELPRVRRKLKEKKAAAVKKHYWKPENRARILEYKKNEKRRKKELMYGAELTGLSILCNQLAEGKTDESSSTCT
jgi:hypothetical protein